MDVQAHEKGIATLATMLRTRYRFVVAMIVAPLLASVVGCAPSVPDRASAPDENFQQLPAGDAEPELVPDGSAHDNLPYFAKILQAFSAGSEPVRGVPVVTALEEAGFTREVMQVSFDESKTQLVADHIYVSVRFGEECLIGQVIESDRSVVTSVQPAVGPEKTICLIGETRIIDW